MLLNSEQAKELGRLGEEYVARYLRDNGCIVIKRNWRDRYGEVDIIAYDNKTLVFVEVKTRTFDYARKYGRAHEAVDKHKMAYLTRAASVYLKKNFRWIVDDLRFDVIEVYVPDNGIVTEKDKVYITHIKDAFVPTKLPYRRK